MKEKELLEAAQDILGGKLATYDGSAVLHLAETNEYDQVVDVYLSPVQAGFRAGVDPVQFTDNLDEAIAVTDQDPKIQEMILSELAAATGLNHDQLRHAILDDRLEARQLYHHGPWLSTIANVEAALEAGTLQRRPGRPPRAR